MQQTIQIPTPAHNGLYDITRQVEAIVAESGVQTGLVNVYVQGATAGIMIQENWDDSVQRDVVSLMNKLIPRESGNMTSRMETEIPILRQGLWGPRRPFLLWMVRWDYLPGRIFSCASSMVPGVPEIL